jgi:hypothetical protein
MTEWKQLPNRTTPDGQTLHTETAEIDGETWYVGNIPSASEQPKRSLLQRLLLDAIRPLRHHPHQR